LSIPTLPILSILDFRHNYHGQVRKYCQQDQQRIPKKWSIAYSLCNLPAMTSMRSISDEKGES
jgi:hypothetical protein